MFRYIPVQATVIRCCALGDVDSCYALRHLKLAVRDREVARLVEEFIVGTCDVRSCLYVFVHMEQIERCSCDSYTCS
jgi:hypothetical protein